MRIRDARETLFKTKNYNKIISSFNALTPKDQIIFLSSEDVRIRINKIANTNFLFQILINLPYNTRYNFLSKLDLENLSSPLDIFLLDFLRLKDFHKWDLNNANILDELNDNKIINLILHKLNNKQIEHLIIHNNNRAIKEPAFFEYSKRTEHLVLTSEFINLFTMETIYAEIKRRKMRNQSTDIYLNDFLSLDKQKQNCLLNNSESPSLIQDLTDYYNKKYQNMNNEELMHSFINILDEFNYPNPIELQIIISESDEETSLKLMQEFFIKVLKFKEPVLDKYAYSLLHHFKESTNFSKDLLKLMKQKPITIINYLNTGIINDSISKSLENKITITQYQKINQRQVNRLIDIINILYHNEINYSQSTCLILAYKLYLVFGYENALDLLKKRFGFLDFKTLYNMFSPCDVRNVELKPVHNTYEPILKKEFISFIIGNKKDNHTTIKRMLRGELDIIRKNFAFIFNDFERYQLQIGEKIHLNKLIPMLTGNGFVLLPNEYKLTSELLDSISKSYRFNNANVETKEVFDKTDERKHMKEACNFYHNYLKSRITSSIPRVKGTTEDNYTYEVLRLDDPLIMTLGYETGCCFRLNGKSKDFLRYCSENPHGRVIVIRNEHKEICSMVPIIRNGNIIVGNSIESNSKGNPISIYNTLKDCFNDIIEVSKEREEKPIIAGLVTNLHENCLSNHKIKDHIYPISIDSFYTNYECDTYIVSSNENIEENDFKFYTPEAIYYDERPEIIIYYRAIPNEQKLKDLITQRMKSISFTKNQEMKMYTYISHTMIVSEDWYIGIDFNRITGKCLDKDPRAIMEYETIKTYLESKIKEDDDYSLEQDVETIKESIIAIDNIVQKKLTF